MDPETYLVIMDAMSAIHLRGHPPDNIFNVRGGLLDQWKKPGDFIKGLVLRDALREERYNQAGPIIQNGNLDGLIEANQEQAMVDFQNEWNPDGDNSDSSGTTTDSDLEDLISGSDDDLPPPPPLPL